MTSEGLGEMFEGDSVDTFAGKFPLVSMGGRAEGLACADPGARTPIGAIGNFISKQPENGWFLCLLVKLSSKTSDLLRPSNLINKSLLFRSS